MTSAPALRHDAPARPGHPPDLAALIAAADAISFDFFDTLFVRPLADPEDAFDILGRRFGMNDFRERRRAAQTEAFRRMHERGRKEITLADIYECWDARVVSSQDAMAAEEALELMLVRPNPELVEHFRRAVASRKPVVITSDMYLPASFFEAALRRNGLPVVRVVISADRNATKRDAGELFDVLIAELGLPPNRILHVGDNAVSDVQRAGEKGLVAYHYRLSRALPALDHRSLDASLAVGQLRLHSTVLEPGSPRELGFVYGGPAALGFLDWVVQMAERDRIDHVLFLARDGFALEKLAGSIDQGSLPRFSYLLGSRTAFTMAAMNAASFADYLPFLLSGSDGLAPAELLERINVPVPAESVMRDLGLGRDVVIDDDNRPLVARFLAAYRWEILKVAKSNRRALFGYLRSLGIASGDRVALVDIGWNGTTQEAFERATRQMLDLEVHGYYFCLADTKERKARQLSHRMTALVAPPLVSTETLTKMYLNRVVAEVFFSAPHHSIVGLVPAEGGVTAVEDAGRGQGASLTPKVMEIVAGIELFADAYRRLRSELGIVTNPAEVVGPFLQLIAGDRWRDYAELAGIRNFDAWASSRNRDMLITDYVAKAEDAADEPSAPTSPPR